MIVLILHARSFVTLFMPGKTSFIIFEFFLGINSVINALAFGIYSFNDIEFLFSHPGGVYP